MKDTPTLIKRSFADVVNDGTNDTKAVEETKIDERNITDNRARRNKNKDKREEKKDGTLEKIGLKKIYSQLLEEEQSKSGERNKSTPPIISTNSSQLKNDSGFSLIQEDILSTQDKEFLSVCEELQTANVSNNIDSTTRHPTACTPQEKTVPLESRQNINTSFAYPRYGVTSEGRLEGYFCSDTVFNLCRKVLTDTEIRILEKGLDFAPIQNKIYEPELRSDFEGFCRRMRTKWPFRNEPTLEFSKTPVFSPKSTWKPPMGHPNVEVFLSQIEHEIFKEVESPLGYSNLCKEEWKAVRSLANDRNIVIKKTERGSCVVIWDRSDYIMEAEKQLNDKAVYKDVNFDKDLIPNLTGKSNRLFETLKRRQLITEKEFKYFRFEFKKTCNLGKLYMLPKIHKRLSNVPGGPVISNCRCLQKKYPSF